MIVKIKTSKRQTFKYLLGYMMNSKERLRDNDGRSFVLTHNLKGKGIASWIQQFRENEKYRLRKRKNSVYLNHEILSWHKDDVKNISLEKLQDMVREYISLRNKNGMYVAVPHFDRDHIHVHICSSAIEYRTGKTMRMSRMEFSDLKKNIQAYQVEKYPELSHSVVRHGRKSRSLVTDGEIQFKRRTGKQTKKEILLAILNDCQKNAKTPEDFFARLKACKLQTYVRGGRVYGVVFENRKYRFKTLGIDIGNTKSREKKRWRTRELQKLRKKRSGFDHER